MAPTLLCSWLPSTQGAHDWSEEGWRSPPPCSVVCLAAFMFGDLEVFQCPWPSSLRWGQVQHPPTGLNHCLENTTTGERKARTQGSLWLLYFQRLHPRSACGSWQCPPLPRECPALLPWGGYHFILREHGSCLKTWELLKFTASTGGRHVAVMGPQAQVSAHVGKPSACSAEDHPALSSFPGISRWSTFSCSQVTTHSMLFDFFNLFIFNWGIIALQYCVGFCHTSAWSSHRYTYVPCLLSSPPTPFHSSRWQHKVCAPCIIQQIPTTTYFTYVSVYVSVLLYLFVSLSPF